MAHEDSNERASTNIISNQRISTWRTHYVNLSVLFLESSTKETRSPKQGVNILYTYTKGKK